MSQNQIGKFGELLTETEFCRPVRGVVQRPLFRATSLGDKYPIVDFIVDLLDSRERILGFFCVQTKSTARARSMSRKRLPIHCPRSKYNALVNLPVPTYIAGVDVIAERVYVCAVNHRRDRTLSSMTKSYELAQDDTKVSLYDEVLSYWQEQTLAAWNPTLTDD